MNQAAWIVGASQNHGPPHELVLGVVVVIGIVGTVAYKVVTGRKGSGDHTDRDRGPDL
jgi:hypothetical protein